jgi:hypothetical protein
LVGGAIFLLASGGLWALLIIEIEYSPATGAQTFVPSVAKLLLTLGGASAAVAVALREQRHGT